MNCDPNTGEISDPIDLDGRPLLIRVEQYTDGEIIPAFIRAGAMNGPFNYNVEKASVESGKGNFLPSLTQQQFAEEADINTIVRRFGLTGQLPDNPRVPVYGDFTEVTDYQTALNAVRQADERFMELPAEVRAAFANDPQRLVEAAGDPAMLPKLRELGLAPPAPEPAVPEPSKVSTVTKAVKKSDQDD